VNDPAVIPLLTEAARKHVLQTNFPKQGNIDFGKQSRHCDSTNVPTALNITFQSVRGDAITVKGGHHISITHSTIRNIGNRAANISGE
jgi:hypothetical protein